MFCHQCGKEIPEESKFCPFCGKEQVKIPIEDKEADKGLIEETDKPANEPED